MFPNFIVIGAAKCGTTSICELLGAHPAVFMCDPKEPCYFSHMDDQKRTREWYEGLFANTGSATAIGEGSTAYTHPDIIEETSARIRESIPDCRLIYMVRHPISRLESDWRMRRHEQWTPHDVSEAALSQASLVDHGLYWKNLSVYRRHFPDEQILIVFLEDFISAPETELGRCLSHIGVEPIIASTDVSRPRNTSADFRKDSWIASTLRELRGFERMKDLAPRVVVEAAKRLLTQPESFEVRWDPEARRQIVARLQADTDRFLQHCGKPADFWKL